MVSYIFINKIDSMKCKCCDGKVQKYGKLNEKQRYYCVDCGKTFSESSIKKEIKRKEKYDKIKKMYLEDGLSTTEIGKILGTSSTVPQRILQKMGVTRSISEAKKGKKNGTKLPVEKIIKLYKEGNSTPKIAEICDCSKRSVLNILIDNGISRDNVYEYSHDMINEIEELYLSGHSMNSVSEILKIPYATINNNLHKLGIVRTEDKFRLGIDYDEWLKNLPIYQKYKSDVIKITNKQPIEKLEFFDKRGLCGVEGAYQLDHKFSISEGFKQGIEPEIIGNIVNLEFIPWEENLNKGVKCSITENELRTIYKNKTELK